MNTIKLLFEIFNCRRLMAHKILLFLCVHIFAIPLSAQPENILTSSIGVGYGSNNSYAIDHEFKNSISYYLLLNYRFYLEGYIKGYFGIEPILRYSNTSFEDCYIAQVHLNTGEYIDLYTENNSAKASFLNILLMFNLGYYNEGGGFDIGLGLGYAWYNIENHVYNLRTEYLYQAQYLLNDDDIVDYVNQSILLNSLKSEAVWSFKLGFFLPISKYLGLESNDLSIGMSLLYIGGLKYTKEYIPEGLHTYYSNVGPEKTADMGSTSLLLSISYKLN